MKNTCWYASQPGIHDAHYQHKHPYATQKLLKNNKKVETSCQEL